MNNIRQRLEEKVNWLKGIDYKYYLGIDKEKINNEIQEFNQKLINEYNEQNKEYFKLIIQEQLYEFLKSIIINYEERKNKYK